MCSGRCFLDAHEIKEGISISILYHFISDLQIKYKNIRRGGEVIVAL